MAENSANAPTTTATKRMTYIVQHKTGVYVGVHRDYVSSREHARHFITQTAALLFAMQELRLDSDQFEVIAV